MTEKRDFDLVDVQIAFCKAYGMSHPETARSISTPEHPAGISEKTVSSRLQKTGPFIAELVRWAAALKREQQLEIKELTATTVRAEMEAKLGTSWATVLQKISEGDADSARWHIEQIIGKASQVHKHEGDVNVNHTLVWQGRRELMEQEQDMLNSEKLLNAAPSDVLESELVDN